MFRLFVIPTALRNLAHGVNDRSAHTHIPFSSALHAAYDVLGLDHLHHFLGRGTVFLDEEYLMRNQTLRATYAMHTIELCDGITGVSAWPWARTG